jgi:hypothetical protein
MHLHHPLAEHDLVHSLLRQQNLLEGDLAKRVQSVSFYLEFSSITRWIKSKEELTMCSAMSPTDFGHYCYRNHIVPITPRFGQSLGKQDSGQKAIYAQCLRLASEKNETDFVATVAAFHELRVLDQFAAGVVAQIVGHPPSTKLNRMQSLVGFLGGLESYGALSIKNLIEAMRAHALWSDITEDEFKHYPYGNDARDFLKWGSVDRGELLKFLRKKWICLADKDIEILDGTTKVVQKVTLQDLAMPIEKIDDMLIQYWSCAQARILSVAEAYRRRVASPIPWHLRRNICIKDQVAKAFASQSYERCDIPDS